MITKSVHRTFRFFIICFCRHTATCTSYRSYNCFSAVSSPAWLFGITQYSAPCPHNQSCAYSPQVRLFPMRAVLYILKHHIARRCLIFEFAHSFLLLPASQTVNYTAIVNVITGAYATPMRGNNPSAHGSMWCVLFSSQGAKRNFALEPYAGIKPAHTPWRGVTLSLHQ